MPIECVLLFTDAVDSTRLTEQLGDVAASKLWATHDGIARRLLKKWSGREIDKSDGFLLLFEEVEHAVAYSLEFHRELAMLSPPLASRTGIHRGAMVARENTADDVALGAKPLELDGLAKAVAARTMMLARGGQTLLSASARMELNSRRWRLQSHGHWRMKGLAEPVELFEVGDDRSLFQPPMDSEKSYRVLRADEGWTPLAELRHGLPAERDGFVGRREVLVTLAARFDDGARLVTVLGIGGIGKTRLALRYARDWLGNYPGGAWFCDLSSARSLDGIVHAVAQGLDVPLGKTDPVQQLGAAIAGRGNCLVVLDNFEQVSRQAEATLGAWLERAPDARMLVTSRDVLGIPGEVVFVLEPMEIEEAVRLFERRAQAADDRYDPTAAERAILPKLADLLDRLPLAIELAAARVRVMNAHEMLLRMGERFKLLVSTGGRQDRQATLRAAIDWSWELLSSTERSTLAQVSVFEGGFTLVAAEAVVELSGAGADCWLADILQSLIEKSLVRRMSHDRLDMLRTVQDYLSARLEEGVVANPEGARKRHCLHYTSLSETSVAARRCEDIDNLVTATRFAEASGDTAAAVVGLVLCAAALDLVGPVSVLIELAAKLGAVPTLSATDLASISRVMGNALYTMGRSAEALAVYETGLLQALAANDPALIIRLRCATADPLVRAGKKREARQHLDEAVVIAQSLDDPKLQHVLLNARGGVAMAEGMWDEALQHYQHALALARSSGHRRREAGLLGNLGVVHYSKGDMQTARESYVRSLDIATEIGDRRWSANARCNLGLLHLEVGLNALAIEEFRVCVITAREMGHSLLEATASCNLGLALMATQETSLAIESLELAAAIASRLEDHSLTLQCWRPLGKAWFAHGDHDQARSAFARAHQVAVVMGSAEEIRRIDSEFNALFGATASLSCPH